MPDAKTEGKADTALNVSSIKKLEAELAHRREAAKTTILAQIGELTGQLGELGFSYQVVENGGGAGTSARRCGNCGAVGHTRPTCPQPQKK